MKTMKKQTGKLIRLAKREAEVLMTAMDMAIHVYGPPECPKCEKSFFSVVEKLDSAFSLGVIGENRND